MIFILIASFIVGISLFTALLAKWLDMYREGYPRNPLKWAQERRWRENASRRVRIMYLEHDLGLHADRTENCVECDRDKQRAFDNKWLSNEIFDLPYNGLTGTIQRAYDSQVAWGTKTIPLPPPPTAQPDRIKK